MKSYRHKQVLEIIIQKLIKYTEINSIYLYGSCARNQEKYNSDVDLFLTLNIPYDKKYSKLIREIRTLEKPYSLPDIDYNFLFSEYCFEDIKSFKNSYYWDVYKDSILLWDNKNGFTNEYLNLKGEI